MKEQLYNFYNNNVYCDAGPMINMMVEELLFQKHCYEDAYLGLFVRLDPDREIDVELNVTWEPVEGKSEDDYPNDLLHLLRASLAKDEDGLKEYIASEYDFSYEEVSGVEVNVIEDRQEVHDPVSFWFVSDWLGARLNALNEPVAEINGQWIWGRTGYNFDPWLESCIQTIYCNMAK